MNGVMLAWLAVLVVACGLAVVLFFVVQARRDQAASAEWEPVWRDTFGDWRDGR